MTIFSPFPPGDYRLVNATVPQCLLERKDGGDRDSGALIPVAITVSAGKIRRIEPMPAAAAELPSIDLDGGMVWPTCADLHTHLDKGHIWSRTPNPTGSWRDAVELVGQDREANWSAEDIALRADFSLRCAYAHGTSAIRTHVDSFGPQSYISWPAMARMRDRWAGRIALQCVSLGMIDMYAGGEGERHANLVAEHDGILGAVVIDHPDPAPALDRVFALARERDLDLDFHADETDNPASNGLAAIAEATIRHGWQGRVTAGHCCSLARQPELEAAHTVMRLAEAGVAVVSLPMCNLYLQDRQARGYTPRWRGVTLVNELATAGVPVSIGSDNTRDPFYAYGDLDPVEVFTQAVRIAQLDSPLGNWVRAVTATPALIMGAEAGMLREGGGADLILFRARNWSELLSRPGGPRLVVRAGRPVVEGPPDFRELDQIRR